MIERPDRIVSNVSLDSGPAAFRRVDHPDSRHSSIDCVVPQKRLSAVVPMSEPLPSCGRSRGRKGTVKLNWPVLAI